MAFSAKFARSCLENNESYSFHITADWLTKLCTLGRPEMTHFFNVFFTLTDKDFFVVVVLVLLLL